jgi:hypothetical protein
MEIFSIKVPANADPSMKLTLLGMQIDPIEQCLKHESSIRAKADSFSNVIEAKVDLEKHDFLKTSTERGMQTDSSEQCRKHDSSKRISTDLLSNVTFIGTILFSFPRRDSVDSGPSSFSTPPFAPRKQD